MASSPPSSFTWGRGGARLTPQDIERQRVIAQQLMAPDYSPIQSPWQGLARVAGNLTGAFRERRADQASEANSADQRRIVEAMMNPGMAGGSTSALDAGPGGMDQVSSAVSGLSDTSATPAGRPAINPAVIEALTSPYVSDEVRALAGRQYTEATRQREPLVVNGHVLDPRDPTRQIADYSAEAEPEVVRLVRAAGIDPASEQGRSMLRRSVEGRIDPIVSVPLPGGATYVGPRSGLPGSVGATTREGPPATLPPDYDFGQGGPTPPASGNFPGAR